MKRLLVTLILFSVFHICHAQRLSFGTNLFGCADFGTMNVDASFAVARHWTLDVSGAYNPWTYKEGTPDQFQNRSLSGSFGFRWWSWHVHAGWWVKCAGRYEVYNRGGILTETSEEGTSYGAGLSAGYALILTRWLNLDFGAGAWGGWRDYRTYRCTSCGRLTDEGGRWFVAPFDLRVSLMFVF